MACGPLAFVCDAAGGAVSTVSASAFDGIADSFGKAAESLADAMWKAISATTTVDLSTAWFKSDLTLVLTLAAVMIAGLFVLQVIKGALQRDPHALGRAITGCGKAFIGASAAIAVTELLLALVDQLSDGIVRTAGMGDVASMGQKIAPIAVLGAGSAITPALVIVLSVLTIIATILVWAVFLLRKAMIVIAAVFAPIAFGGAASDGTRSWVRKWIEFTVAMVFSKLAMVIIFVIATSMVGQSGTGAAGLSDLITGILLLLLASFTPWTIHRLVHFIGGDIIAAHQSSMASDARAAKTAAAAPARQFKGAAQKVLARTGGAAAGANASSPAAAGAVAAGPASVAASGAAAAVAVPTAAATKVASTTEKLSTTTNASTTASATPSPKHSGSGGGKAGKQTPNSDGARTIS
jgi:type IV secretion system protein TrbL